MLISIYAPKASSWRISPSMCDGANRRLELFADWPHIDLVRPGAALLPVKLEIGFGDRNRSQNVVGFRAVLLTNHAVDDHVGDVKASWTEFAGHTLSQSAKTELWDGKGRKADTTTDRAGGAAKDDRAAFARQHHPDSFPTDKKSAEAAGTPCPFEELVGNVENAGTIPCSDIVHHQIGRAELRRNPCKHCDNLVAHRRIAGVTANEVAMLHHIGQPAPARNCDHVHARLGKAPTMTAICFSVIDSFLLLTSPITCGISRS